MEDILSQKTKQVISISREEAIRLGNDFISNEHFVLAILKAEVEPAKQLLIYFKADIDALQKQLELSVRNKSGKSLTNVNSLPLSKLAENVINQSVSEAKESGGLVEPEHLLSAIVKLNDSVAAKILAKFNITYASYKEICSKEFSVQSLIWLTSAKRVSFEAIVHKGKEITALRTKKNEVVKQKKSDDAAYMRNVEKEMMEELNALIYKWEQDIEIIPYEKEYFDNELLSLRSEKFIADVYKDTEWAGRVHNWKSIVEKRVKQDWTEMIEKISSNAATTVSKYQVFISKKESDYLLCKPVYDFLTEKNVNVFLSEESLQHVGNSDYMEEIDKALDEADHLIIFCSKAEYFTSPYVKAEWKTFVNEKRAGRKKGNIISVIDGSINIHEIPIALRSFEVIKINPGYLQRIHQYVHRQQL